MPLSWVSQGAREEGRTSLEPRLPTDVQEGRSIPQASASSCRALGKRALKRHSGAPGPWRREGPQGEDRGWRGEQGCGRTNVCAKRLASSGPETKSKNGSVWPDLGGDGTCGRHSPKEGSGQILGCDAGKGGGCWSRKCVLVRGYPGRWGCVHGRRGGSQESDATGPQSREHVLRQWPCRLTGGVGRAHLRAKGATAER